MVIRQTPMFSSGSNDKKIVKVKFQHDLAGISINFEDTKPAGKVHKKSHKVFERHYR